MRYITLADCSEEKIRMRLQDLARDIISELSESAPEQCKELLSDFVSELFLTNAEQNLREERRQRQAEGIAAARARGVQFGRRKTPLPEDFDELHRAFRNGKLTLLQAAEACDMTRSTFYNAVLRKEQELEGEQEEEIQDAI